MDRFGQWKEPRFYERAAQIVQRDPNPRRRLFEPARVVRPQPRTHQLSRAPTVAPGLDMMYRSSIPASLWPSDFSDHSEWEPAWFIDHYDNDDSIPPATNSTWPEDAMPATTPTGNNSSSAAPALCEHGSLVVAAPASSKVRNINALVKRLRGDHECLHDK